MTFTFLLSFPVFFSSKPRIIPLDTTFGPFSAGLRRPETHYKWLLSALTARVVGAFRLPCARRNCAYRRLEGCFFHLDLISVVRLHCPERATRLPIDKRFVNTEKCPKTEDAN